MVLLKHKERKEMTNQTQTDKLVELHFELRNDFLEACGEENGKIVPTDKSQGVLVALKKVAKLLKEEGVTV